MLDSSAIDVHTEVFEGPLDLLLYLIKKDNLDIYDIPIAQITQEYLAYLDVMKELNLDMAGEFLLMAATLMQIKVRMLLPSQEESDQDQGPDPRTELAAKLAEYEKYKAAALVLDSKYDAFKDIFYRGSPKFAESDKVLNLDLFDLLAAVKRAFEAVDDKDDSTMSAELFPIETRMEKIVALLNEREWILLDDVFKGEKKKLGVITCFMAMLELIKQKKIFARQDKGFGEVRIYLSKEEPAAEQPQAQDLKPAQEEPKPAPPLDENAQPLNSLPLLPKTSQPRQDPGQEPEILPETSPLGGEHISDDAAAAFPAEEKQPGGLEQAPGQPATPNAPEPTQATPAEQEPARDIPKEEASRPACGPDPESASAGIDAETSSHPKLEASAQEPADSNPQDQEPAFHEHPDQEPKQEPPQGAQ